MVHFYKYIVEEKTFKFSPVFENILEGLKLLDKSTLEDALTCVSLLVEFIGVLTISNFFQQEDKQQEFPTHRTPTLQIMLSSLGDDMCEALLRLWVGMIPAAYLLVGKS